MKEYIRLDSLTTFEPHRYSRKFGKKLKVQNLQKKVFIEHDFFVKILDLLEFFKNILEYFKCLKVVRWSN